MRAGIALGANLGDRLLNLTTARARIFNLPGASPPYLSSAVYESDAVDCEPGANRFLNAVVEIGYSAGTQALFDELKKIEAALGRPSQHRPNHSRTIDLDLLYHGGREIDGTQLQLPHPRLHLRAFVLHPLAEIRPNLVLPGQVQTVGELSTELAAGPSVVRAAKQW